MKMKWLLFVLAGLLVALAGCAGAPVEQARATPTPFSSAPAGAATASPATPAAATPTPTMPVAETDRVVRQVVAPSNEDVAVRSGRAVRNVAVRVQPGGDVVGELPAGALAIVTESRGDSFRIVFGGAPAGYGWVPQDAISFAVSQQAAGSSQVEPAPASATPTAPPTTSTPAAQRAVPTRTLLSGRVVFQDRSGGNIYIMNADGSSLRRLTYGFEPALSPDGQQVSFTRWDEPRGLWVINVDGSGERLLLGANRARSPTWAPDGTAIVFERNVGEKVCRRSPFGCLTDDELRVLFGGQDCRSTPFGALCIEDFERITLRYTALTEVQLADGATRDLPAQDSALAPQWQPSGDTVVYLDSNGLFLTQVSTSDAPRRLVETPSQLAPASFSPDGQSFYAARNMGNRWDIWRWRADGSQPTALTAPDPLDAQPASNVAPSVSPDGRHVVFLTDRNGQWELWVMDSDGGNPRPLAPQALAGVSFVYDFNAERMVDWGP